MNERGDRPKKKVWTQEQPLLITSSDACKFYLRLINAVHYSVSYVMLAVYQGTS